MYKNRRHPTEVECRLFCCPILLGRCRFCSFLKLLSYRHTPERPLVFAEKFIGCGVGAVIGGPPRLYKGLCIPPKGSLLDGAVEPKARLRGLNTSFTLFHFARYNLRQYSGGNRAEEHQQEYEPGIGGSAAAVVERINAPEHTGYHANIETGEG